MSFVTKFGKAAQTKKRAAVIDLLRSSPGTTLRQLQPLLAEHGPLLANIRLSDILGDAKPEKGSKVAAPAPGKARSASKELTAKAAGINTRTPEARAAYDKDVLEALRKLGDGQSAPAIAKAAGGTALQVRTALTRLINSGHATWTGKARGTRYSVA